MPGCVNALKTGLLLLAMLPACLQAKEIGAKVVSVDGRTTESGSVLNARLDYSLGATAKEAIKKGVPLSWVLRVQWQKKIGFWHVTIDEVRVPYVIQYQALLNQYSVKNLMSGRVEMFAGLNAALNHMERIRGLALPWSVGHAPDNYRVVVKTQFDREFLPIPLRPESYFDSQWALSSDWFIWRPQK